MKKPEVKMIQIAIVALLALLMMLPFFLHSSVENCGEKIKPQTFYSIEILSHFDENYTVILPIAVTEEWRPARVMNDVELKSGEASFKIISTFYGWAIKIEGSRNVTISGEANYFSFTERPSIVSDVGPYLNRSWLVWTDVPSYWNTTIYSSMDGIQIRIYYSSTGSLPPSHEAMIGWSTVGSPPYSPEVKLELKKGWNHYMIYPTVYRSYC